MNDAIKDKSKEKDDDDKRGLMKGGGMEGEIGRRWG